MFEPDRSPRVFLIGETKLDYDAVDEFLEANGTPTWTTEAPSDGEFLTELAGRVCYQAFPTEEVDGAFRYANANLTRIREGNDVYVGNLIKQLHGSVLEHTHTTWAIMASRIFTHEIVRHRHANVSQESGRFVRDEANEPFIIFTPDEIAENPKAEVIWDEALAHLTEARNKLVDLFGLNDPKMPFALKKRLTSAIRRIAPEGRSSAMIWSANLRDLRYIIEARTSQGAEVEARMVFNQVATTCLKRWPNAFFDMMPQEIDDHGLAEWKFTYRKV